jgi:hypothetical protein
VGKIPSLFATTELKLFPLKFDESGLGGNFLLVAKTPSFLPQPNNSTSQIFMAIFRMADLLPWGVGIAGVADRVVGGRRRSRRWWASSWWVADLGWLAATPKPSRATPWLRTTPEGVEVASRDPLWVGGVGAGWLLFPFLILHLEQRW